MHKDEKTYAKSNVLIFVSWPKFRQISPNLMTFLHRVSSVCEGNSDSSSWMNPAFENVLWNLIVWIAYQVSIANFLKTVSYFEGLYLRQYHLISQNIRHSYMYHQAFVFDLVTLKNVFNQNYCRFCYIFPNIARFFEILQEFSLHLILNNWITI